MDDWMDMGYGEMMSVRKLSKMRDLGLCLPIYTQKLEGTTIMFTALSVVVLRQVP